MRKPLISEPVSQTRSIPIIECGEPLVDFLEACPLVFQDRPRFKYKRATLLREGIAKMIDQASRNLPKGYKLAIVEGWRPPYIQRRMHAWNKKRFKDQHPEWSEAVLMSVVNRFTAPMVDYAPPPHTTGGAVDLMLAREDHTLCEHLAPFERQDRRGFSTNVKGLSAEACETRRILADALLPTGITNYPSEYWHWSYGDQGWAYRGGHPNALYGPVQPEGWDPQGDDDVSQPLEWVLE